MIQIVPWNDEDYDWDEDFYGLSHSEASEQAWTLPQTVKLGVSSRYEVIAIAIGQEPPTQHVLWEQHRPVEARYVVGAVYGGLKGNTFGMDVIVLPTHRRLGIAKQLIGEALERYLELQEYWEDMGNSEPLIFEVHVVNPILIPYFERLGFTIYDRKIRFLHTADERHEVLMRY